GGDDQVRLPLHDDRELGPAQAPVPALDGAEERRRRVRLGRAADRRAVRRRALQRPRPARPVPARRAPADLLHPGGAGRRGARARRPLRAARRLQLPDRRAPRRGPRHRRPLRRHRGDPRARGRSARRLGGGRRGRAAGLLALPGRAAGAARRRPQGDRRLRRPLQHRLDDRLDSSRRRAPPARDRQRPARGRVLPRRPGAADGPDRSDRAGSPDPDHGADTRLGGGGDRAGLRRAADVQPRGARGHAGLGAVPVLVDAGHRRARVRRRLPPRFGSGAADAALRRRRARLRVDEVAAGVRRPPGAPDRHARGGDGRPRAARADPRLALGRDRSSGGGADRDRCVRRCVARRPPPAAARAEPGRGHLVNVVIVSGIWPPDVGGPASHAPELADFLHGRGHAVHVVTTADAAPEPRPYPVDWMPRRYPPGVRHFFTAGLVHRAGREADVVYSTGMLGRSVLGSMGGPLVVRLAGDPVYERALRRGWTAAPLDRFQAQRGAAVAALRRLRDVELRRARRIVVPSRALAAVVAGWGFESEVVPHAVSAPALPEKPGEEPTLVFAGRLVPQKALAVAFEAVRRNPHVRLLVAGDGPERARAESDAPPNASFLGAQPRAKVFELLRAADATLLSSDWESFGLVAAESL